jgi:phospholipase/carboxylesterase
LSRDPDNAFFADGVPLVPEHLPALSPVHVWIAAGNQDPISPTSETQRLPQLLRRAGADVTIHFASTDHALTNSEVETAKHWLEKLQP